MIVAVSMVRDEADVIGHTIRHLLDQGVGAIVVADNLSTDTTRSQLELFPQVTVIDDPDPAYEQATKMTRLAHIAYGMGAEWVLPFDADELVCSPVGTVAEFLGNCSADVALIQGWDFIARRSVECGNPFLQIDHRRAFPQSLPKVAFRAHPDARLHMGNHDVDHPGKVRCDGLTLRHYQYRSLDQMVRKLRTGKAAYDACDPRGYVGLNYRLRHFGTHWGEGGGLSDDEIAARWYDLCEESGLVKDPL